MVPARALVPLCCALALRAGPAPGAVAVADPGRHTVRVLDAWGRPLRAWGLEDRPGWVDGDAAGARFREPRGLAAGPDGALWLADAGNHVIRRIAPDGTVATVAGDGRPGHLDGARPEGARFRRPVALAWAGDLLLILDAGNGAVRKLRPGGRVSTLLADGQPLRLEAPGAMALHAPSGCLFLLDGRRLLRLTPAGAAGCLTQAGTGWRFAALEAAEPFPLAGPGAGLAALEGGLLVLGAPGSRLTWVDLDARGEPGAPRPLASPAD